VARRSRVSVQKRERESRKSERRLRKAARTATRQEPATGTPDAGPTVQAPEIAPSAPADDLRLRSTVGTHGTPACPRPATAHDHTGNTV
jgi:hypothetical protein